jgi:hypothetical protein
MNIWMSTQQDHTNKTHTREKKTYKTVTAAERIQWQYSRNEIQQQNNDVPGSMGRQVNSAVVSPLIKSLPNNGPYVAETCCKLENICKFKAILNYFNNHF